MSTPTVARRIDRTVRFQVPAGFRVLAPARLLALGEGIAPHSLQVADWPELQDRIAAVSLVASVLAVAAHEKVHRSNPTRTLVKVRKVHVMPLEAGDVLCLRGWTSFYGEVAVWPLERNAR